MKRVKKYDELSNLISNHFKKGVFTNCFISKEEFENYINKKRLFYSIYNGGLLIFIKMRGYYNLKYYINDLNYDLKIPMYRKIVVEIAGNSKENIDQIINFFRRNKLNLILNRVRFSCKEAEVNEKLTIEKVEKVNLKDYRKIIKILRKYYDKYTGCIPSNENIKLDIINGNFYCYKDSNKILGILHIASKTNKSEMRHLAVLKKYRGKNIAKCLITEYLLDVKEKSKQVWTSTDNKVTKNLFESFGYKEDGYISYVLSNNVGATSGRP